MVYKFFDKKSQGSGIAANNEIKENIQLANKLHKPIIRTFRKRKVYSSFRDNIWGVDLADMQLLCKFRFRFLLCVIDYFSKHARVIPLKDKRGIIMVKESNQKPNKIWVNKGSEFYDNSFIKWLQDNSILMYSTNNEGKSVIAERFIRTLKNKKERKVMIKILNSKLVIM